jgi:hypothetical protein
VEQAMPFPSAFQTPESLLNAPDVNPIESIFRPFDQSSELFKAIGESGKHPPVSKREKKSEKDGTVPSIQKYCRQRWPEKHWNKIRLFR